ncbi:MAG: bifunctional riboflavin kinase/FAD synthetase [Acidobacteriota bacterium]|nr:bifunctional riboflavin kinase/FAD synthetase [Acidobacteriota bacterium]
MSARNFTVYRSLGEIPANFPASVASIGNFDGVHLGHRSILSAVVQEARSNGTMAVAVTFDPHPEQILRPANAPQLLAPMDRRVRLLAQTGVDAVVVLPFDAQLAAMPARTFVQRVLVDHLHVLSLHEGSSFRFGVRAEAGVTQLAAFGSELGFSVHVHEAIRVHGVEVSSSAIRKLVSEGDMKRARWLLGRPFSIVSTQQRDRGVGSKQLVPTINLAAYAGQLPAFGVYVTRLSVVGRCFDGVTNVGNRPTFEGAGFSVETHLLNFEPMEIAFDAPIELTFLHRLRGEQKWPNPEALKAQIMKDVAQARRYLALIPVSVLK